MPPPRVSPAGVVTLVIAIVGFIVVVIFVGFNFYHAKTMREEQAGQIDSRDAPKSSTDLQGARPTSGKSPP